MKSGLLLASAVLLCVLGSGCSSINLAHRGSCASCANKAGCGQMACTGVVNSGVAGTGGGAVAGTPGDPGAVAGAGPYDPGAYGGYGGRGRFGRGFGGRGDMDPGMGGPPSAQVAYPYYTTRGPRDFLTNNPPSIGY